MKVSLPLPEGMDASKVAVYRINDDGTKTLIVHELQDGKVVFLTNHFSLYAVVERDASASAAAATGQQGGGLTALDEAAVPLASTEPGTDFALLLWLVPIALVLGLGTVLIVRRRLGRDVAAAGPGGGAPGPAA
ncbi:MAG: hypothetical protein LBP28_06135 [Coriobacteriales bacterium]|nr:hypothetical protein [Coriobacteriales bacterium]